MRQTPAFGERKAQLNLVPLPYFCVSYQLYRGPWSEAGLRDHLLNRPAYRSTDYIAFHDGEGRHALVSIRKRPHAPDALFSPIEAVEILALPDTCRFVRDTSVDPNSRSALARLARAHGVTKDQTLIVWAEFDHITFVHRPDPLVVKVVEVVPPHPPKLFVLASRVLERADLPPIVLQLETIDLVALAQARPASSYLLPCRSGGLEGLPAPVHFLDDRPEVREDWTLLGCQQGINFHRAFYGDEDPPLIDMCPRNLVGATVEPTLLKCCLLVRRERPTDPHVTGYLEQQGARMVVPWSATPALLEEGLRRLAAEVPYA